MEKLQAVSVSMVISEFMFGVWRSSAGIFFWIKRWPGPNSIVEVSKN